MTTWFTIALAVQNNFQLPAVKTTLAPVSTPVTSRAFGTKFVSQDTIQAAQNIIQKEAPEPVQPAQNIIQKEPEKNTVLDFSSGSAQVVENTATQVEQTSEENVQKGAQKGFSIFRGMVEKLNLELADVGNITIFSPDNRAFENLPFNVEELDEENLRKLALKHFVKGTLKKKDMINGPVSLTQRVPKSP